MIDFRRQDLVGVMSYGKLFDSQCVHWGRGLIPNTCISFAAIPLVKELALLIIYFFAQCVTLHCIEERSHLSLGKKSRLLCADDD